MKIAKLFAFSAAAALAGCTSAAMPPVVSASQTGLPIALNPIKLLRRKKLPNAIVSDAMQLHVWTV